MNNILNELFENESIEILIDSKEGLLFEIYSTGMALGYVTKNRLGKIYPHKVRINTTIENGEVSTCVRSVHTYMDLENLKKFISVAHTEKKIDFIMWLKEKGFVSYDEVFDTTTKETIFIKELENALKNFNIKGIKQYKILNYKIDYYIPSLNIAIEYDEEEKHKYYTYEQEEGRQERIEKELNCKFIRVSDKNNLGYNIGYVLKEIFNINVN